MTIAHGIRKTTSIKKQVGVGTPATGAGGQILRRQSAVFTFNASTFESDEIVSHQQSTGVDIGMLITGGKVDGLLSPSTYKLYMASAMRKDFVAGATTGAQVNITSAVTSGAQGTFTRAAGSFLTDGFKIGDVVRWTGWATTGVPNNAHNFFILGLTATVMTVLAIDLVPVGAKAAGDSVTCTVQGKKTLVPLTGHTDDVFTIEDWYPDVVQSEMFTDVRLNQMSVDMPASGNVKVSFDLPGLKRTKGAVQQLTAPTAETGTGILTAVTGVLVAGGVVQAAVTGMKFQVDEGVAPDGPVVGSRYAPDASRGRVRVSGSFTGFFQDGVLSALFEAETVTGLAAVAAVDNSPAADFCGFSFSRVKLTGDAPDDGEKAVLRTYPFTAEINVLGGAALANDQTIMSIQDSAA